MFDEMTNLALIEEQFFLLNIVSSKFLSIVKARAGKMGGLTCVINSSKAEKKSSWVLL